MRVPSWRSPIGIGVFLAGLGVLLSGLGRLVAGAEKGGASSPGDAGGGRA